MHSKCLFLKPTIPCLVLELPACIFLYWNIRWFKFNIIWNHYGIITQSTIICNGLHNGIPMGWPEGRWFLYHFISRWTSIPLRFVVCKLTFAFSWKVTIIRSAICLLKSLFSKHHHMLYYTLYWLQSLRFGYHQKNKIRSTKVHKSFFKAYYLLFNILICIWSSHPIPKINFIGSSRF